MASHIRLTFFFLLKKIPFGAFFYIRNDYRMRVASETINLRIQV